MSGTVPGSVREVSPTELSRMLQSESAPMLLDVRNPWESEICSIGGSTLIPLGAFAARAAELPADRSIAVYCHHGIRSLMAAQFLAERGFDAISLAGGIAAWADEIEPGMKRY